MRTFHRPHCPAPTPCVVPTTPSTPVAGPRSPCLHRPPVNGAGRAARGHPHRVAVAVIGCPARRGEAAGSANTLVRVVGDRGCPGYFLHPASNRLIVACTSAILTTDERSSQDKGGNEADQARVAITELPGPARRTARHRRFLARRCGCGMLRAGRGTMTPTCRSYPGPCCG